MALIRADQILPQLESETLRGRLKHSTIRRWLWMQDLVVISACAALAVTVASWLPGSDPLPGGRGALPVVVLIVLAWSALLAVNGGYRFRQWGFGVNEYNRVITASLETFALLAMAMYLTHFQLPRSWVLALFLLAVPAIIAGRRLVRTVIHRLRAAGIGRKRVLLVGASKPVGQLRTVLQRERWLGLAPVGALCRGEDLGDDAGAGALGDTTDVVDAVSDFDADIVIFCEGAFHECTEFNILARRLERRAVQLVVVPALTDISAQRIAMVPVAGLPLVFVEKPYAQRASSRAKRVFDMVVAGGLLLLAAPVMAIAAFLIKVEDGGPVFFRQQRVGRDGRLFNILKLRSMVCEAEQLLVLQGLRPDDGDWILFKMRVDPRVTRVGRFIRRYSIDELPQLWNVIRGDMSIVGPRPALPCEVAKYASTVRRRLDVRPGITGLWQVSGRADLSWEDTVRLDLYYVDNWSMLQDAVILLRTARAVTRPTGAY
jgi:exopolysaccharide biosynthesis polyprenyl glycosylphosphotransferase